MNFYAKKEGEELEIEDSVRFDNYIKSLPDGRVVVAVKRYRKPRSVNQNRLYWAWLNIIGGDLGYDTEELHTSFKAMYLTDRSREFPIVRSTTVLNSAEFTKYLSKIQRQASELGIVLPTAEEYYKYEQS